MSIQLQPSNSKSPKKRPFLLNLNSAKPNTRVGASFWDDANVPLSPKTPRSPSAPYLTPLSSPTTPTFRMAKFTPPPPSPRTPTRFTFRVEETPPAIPTFPGFGLLAPNSPDTGVRGEDSTNVPCSPKSHFPLKERASFPSTTSVTSPPLSPNLIYTPRSITPVGQVSRAGKGLGMKIWTTSRSKCKSLLQGKGSGDREAALEQTVPLLRGRGDRCGSAQGEAQLVGPRSSSEGTEAGTECTVSLEPLASKSMGVGMVEMDGQVPVLPEFTPLLPLTLTLSDVSSLCSPPSTPTSASMLSTVPSSFLSPPPPAPTFSLSEFAFPTSKPPSPHSPSTPISFPARPIKPLSSTSSSLSLSMPLLSPLPLPSSSAEPSLTPSSSSTSSTASLTSTSSSVSVSIFAVTPPRKSSLYAFPLIEEHLNSRPASCASHRSSLSATFSVTSSIASSSSRYSAKVASTSLIKLFPAPPTPHVLSLQVHGGQFPASSMRPKARRAARVPVGVRTSSPPECPLPACPATGVFVLSPAPRGKNAAARGSEGKAKPSPCIQQEDADDEDSDVDPTLYECAEWRTGGGERDVKRWERQRERARSRSRRMRLGVIAVTSLS